MKCAPALLTSTVKPKYWGSEARVTLLAFLIVAVQAATGAALWALVRRRGPVSVFELLGVGIALGTFASMLTGVMLVSTPLDGVGWLIPTFVAVPALAWARARGHLADLRIRGNGAETAAVLVGLVTGLALVAVNWSRVPLSAPTTKSFADLYFFEALSRGLAEFGPSQSILMSGGSLRYHWFTYAWAGDLAQDAGTAPFVVLTRILPLVTLIGVTAIVAAWAARLSHVRWVPTLAVLLIVAGGYAGALYGSILNFDSPSQAMTTMWLLGFAVVFLAYVRTDLSWPALLAIAAFAAACTGGKISHALVAAGGAGLVVLVGLLARSTWWRRALVATVVAGASMAFVYVVVLSGVAVDRNLTETVAVKASTWQGLDPIAGRLGIGLGTAALVLAILARLGGLGWLLGRRASRLKPDVIFATGGVLVGLAAMLALRDGVNELWFILAASAPAAVLSADGIGSALKRVRRSESNGPLNRPLLWSVVIAIPASVACLALSRNWSTNQALLNWLSPLSVWLLVPLGALIVVAVFSRTRRSMVNVIALSIAGLAVASIATRPAAVWTASRAITTEAGTVQPVGGGLSETALPSPILSSLDATTEVRYAWRREAAEWIAAATPEDAIVATGDPISALVPALTGRQMYLAGQLYQAGLGRAGELDDVGSRAVNSRQFAATPTPQAARPLCDAGVDYVWLDGQLPGISPDAVAFSNEGVTILNLAALGCA